MKIKKIEWSSKQNDQIEHTYGKIGIISIFSIVRFKSDPYIMASNVIPMAMKKGDDLKKLQKESAKEMQQFVKNVTIVDYKNVIRK